MRPHKASPRLPSFQGGLLVQSISTGKQLQIRTEQLPAGFSATHAHQLEPDAAPYPAASGVYLQPRERQGSYPRPAERSAGLRGSPGSWAAAARSPPAPPAQPARCCGGQCGRAPAAPPGSSPRCGASPRRQYLSEATTKNHTPK